MVGERGFNKRTHETAMTNIRRYFQPGHTCFLTHVTFGRHPILAENYDLLWNSLDSVRTACPFVLIAWVVLPDHFHLVVTQQDHDLSGIMQRIKLSFSSKHRKRTGAVDGQTWQYRFWDHVIRDQDDLNRHIDYVHFNPAKHGLVADPFMYSLSSLHDFHARGLCGRDWGVKETVTIDGEFGE